MLRSKHVVPSPVGELTLVADDHGICGLYMTDQRHLPAWLADVPVDTGAFDFEAAVGQLEEYFSGQRTVFDVPLSLTGTDFQRAVWAGLQEIPYGATLSYAQLAARIGNPGAFRAVGLANGRNPVGIIVPCHRVVGASGGLTGYGGGLPRKQALLDLERGVASPEQLLFG